MANDLNSETNSLSRNSLLRPVSGRRKEGRQDIEKNNVNCRTLCLVNDIILLVVCCIPGEIKDTIGKIRSKQNASSFFLDINGFGSCPAKKLGLWV